MKKVTQDVLVAYASRNGSTEKIANWVGKEIRGNVEILDVSNVHNMNYDFIVLGTPIYNHQPLQDMEDFVNKYKKQLKSKNKAVFVVTSDNESRTKRDENIKAFTKIIPGEINSTAVFAGEIDMDELSYPNQLSAQSYLNSIGKSIGSYSKLNEKQCREYGKALNSYL